MTTGLWSQLTAAQVSEHKWVSPRYLFVTGALR
jgi:hypothetical protein